MFFRKVNLNILSTNIPCEITIRDCNGCYIERRIINTNFYSFCLCTNACCVSLSGRYGNQVITKSIDLTNCFCHSYDTNFNFILPSLQPATQAITLTDAKYNLPIDNAILFFSS